MSDDTKFRAMRTRLVFVLVSDTGWPVPQSANWYAKGVRAWADENWRGDGGYECAKRQGFRVQKAYLTKRAMV
jgi:hypothetical protein